MDLCITTAILPLFSDALEHGHNYPPNWGPLKLGVEDFADLLRSHFEQQFLDRYHRRENEYRATIRVYCKHKINKWTAPGVGDIGAELSKLALTINSLNAAGRTYVECGGCVSDRVHPPVTVLDCPRCNRRVCGACEMPIHQVSGDSHVCKSVDRADTLQELLGLKRGRDVQQCPNNACRNIIGLGAGCNHMNCNRCGAHFRFICGKEINPDGDRFGKGQSCPRYNQPGSENAQFDVELADELDQLIIRPLVHVALVYRLSVGGELDREWLLETLRHIVALRDWDEEGLEACATNIRPSLVEVEPPPPRTPGEVILVASEPGIDIVAMRYAEWLMSYGPSLLRRHPDGPERHWYEELVRDLELRELRPGEFEELRGNLSLAWFPVSHAYVENLFNIAMINSRPEVRAWAIAKGYELVNEIAVRLRHLIDVLITHINRLKWADGGQAQDQCVMKDHAWNPRRIQEFGTDMANGLLPELSRAYNGYVVEIVRFSGEVSTSVHKRVNDRMLKWESE